MEKSGERATPKDAAALTREPGRPGKPGEGAGAPGKSASAPDGEGVFSARYRALTAGLVLSVTLVAFLWLGVATVLPRTAEELGGLGLFGWAFTAFMLANLFGTVVAGQGADRAGPIRPYLQMFALFVIGCLVAAVADNWYVFLVGRTLQGAGVGGVLALAYLIVGRAYPDALRSRMLALVASAWTLPALLGPAVAGAIAEASNWRVVFLVLVPLVPLGVLLTLPGLRTLGPPEGPAPDRRRIPLTLLLVAGAGALLAGLEERNVVIMVPLVVAGAAVALPVLRTLLPPGTLTVRRGMPAGMIVRGLVSTAYYGAESFFPLSMAQVLGLNTLESGLALSAGALTWVSGAWIQAKLDARGGGKGRHTRVVVGFFLLLAGDALIAVAIGTALHSIALAVLGWALAGFGMGLVYPAVTTIVLSLAPKGQEGAASSNLQLSETLSVAVMTGVGTAAGAYGAAHGWARHASLGVVFTITAVAALLGIGAGLRTAVRKS
ncbi:MFS transporter [Streptomyces sp. MST-110588]|uniref:MFS transporter n=1 Tax=Streptomyces sp. MST-110588 TaxID=2833628 RepID=UPI001F5D4BDC|nr:MFS transporter [Streptomyces sp. MST-110588]UNO42884.1 MFS transporter [Streptomyces sp. MST-110588]